jgi:hypothetical protein
LKFPFSDTFIGDIFMRWHFSLKPIYEFFAPADGFAEAVIVVSLTATIVLAFMGKLTDSYAAALTAIGGLGVVHDNCSAWLAGKLGRFGQNGQQNNPANPPDGAGNGS